MPPSHHATRCLRVARQTGGINQALRVATPRRLAGHRIPGSFESAHNLAEICADREISV
jgi:hypothetical protein